ncbi:MAG TPA: inositol monophosphatase family protein [Solirubrobacteraceae bacterium]|nr:inositol monophosphatase family protein [Solirubrobacteraceae bacterium]
MFSELLDVAGEAARAAAAVLLERFGAEGVDVRAKSTPTDLVSAADLEAERALRAALAARRPGDAVLGEEGGDLGGGEGGLRWVVDPLDGTVNFLFGIPHWCVSVACEDSDGALVGVVHDPLREETFAAARGGPATLNGVPVRASARDELTTAMVATGFGYDAELRAAQARVAARVLPRVRDLRRFGSAALDLAWTACGRYDAYFERGLNPWDRAAGALLCRRAGLELRELAPDGVLPGGLLVAPAALIGPLGELVGS